MNSAEYKQQLNSYKIEPVKLSAKRVRNRLADAGFPHTWRAHEAQNGSFEVLLELVDSQVLYTASLYLLHTVVVAVKVFPVCDRSRD